MTDESQSTQPLVQAASPGPAPAQAPSAQQASSGGSAGSEHPEVIVGAAFAAGFGLAMILRRLTR